MDDHLERLFATGVFVATVALQIDAGTLDALARRLVVIIAVSAVVSLFLHFNSEPMPHRLVPIGRADNPVEGRAFFALGGLLSFYRTLKGHCTWCWGATLLCLLVVYVTASRGPIQSRLSRPLPLP